MRVSAQRCLPLIEVGLSRLQALEAKPLERCSLSVSDPRLHFAFAIGIFDPTRHRHHPVV